MNWCHPNKFKLKKEEQQLQLRGSDTAKDPLSGTVLWPRPLTPLGRTSITAPHYPVFLYTAPRGPENSDTDNYSHQGHL